MTAFEDLECGDIVWASDPLSEKGRPMLVLGTPRLPSHGVQLITVLISTKTYHEASLTLQDHDYSGDGLARDRNSAPVNELKEAHDYRCQVCDEQRRRGLDVYYAEGHHLHPLRRGGPDERANLLVLCPNHHADFDYGTIAVDPHSYELRHLHEDAIDERVLTIHEVAPTYLEYHDREIAVPTLRS